MSRSSLRRAQPSGNHLARRHAGTGSAGRRRAEGCPHQVAPRHRAPSSPVTRPTTRPLLVVTLVTLAGVFLGPGAGWGYWTAQAFGEGTATTGTLTPPTDVAAAVQRDPGTVVVSWTAAGAPGGAPEHGYYVTLVQVSDNSTAAACGTSPSAPTASLTCEDQPQPDGDYQYLVTAVHHSWTAESSPSNTVTVDTVAPDAPSAPELTAASDTGSSSTDGVTGDSTSTFTGTAEADSTVTLYAGGTPVGSGVATVGSYSITATSVLADGAHTVTATATDAAGNTGAASPGILITIDTERPAVTVNQQTEQADPTNSEPVNFDVVFSEPVTDFTADDVALTAPAGATVLVTGTGATYTVAVGEMTADGTVTVSVGTDAAFDLAGNGNSASTSTDDTVTLDTTPPAAPSTPVLTAASDSGSSDSDRITNMATPTFTGTAEAGATVTLYSDGVAVGTAVATSGAYSVTASALTGGNHTFTATATDAAGNTSPVSTGTSVTIDITAPTPPPAPDLTAASDSWSSLAAGTSDTDDITNVTTPTFTGTAEADASVILYSGGDAVGTAVAASGSYTLTTSTLAEGPQTITATATDVAGNTSPLLAGLVVTIDSVAPVVAIDSVTYSNGRVTSSGTAGIAAGDTSTVQVVICKQNSFPCTSANTLHSGTPSVGATGGWTDTSPNLKTCTLLLLCTGPGQIYVQATQTDHAGNIGISDTVSRNYA